MKKFASGGNLSRLLSNWAYDILTREIGGLRHSNNLTCTGTKPHIGAFVLIRHRFLAMLNSFLKWAYMSLAACLAFTFKVRTSSRPPQMKSDQCFIGFYPWPMLRA